MRGDEMKKGSALLIVLGMVAFDRLLGCFLPAV